MDDLATTQCEHRSGDGDRISAEGSAPLLAKLDGWDLGPDGRSIERVFRFEDYHRTMAFVNAVAWIAHDQDHHPDLGVGYDRVSVRFSTHSVGGLSLNDFICAARIDRL